LRSLAGEQNFASSAKDLRWILNESRCEIVSTMSTVCKNHESGREQSRIEASPAKFRETAVTNPGVLALPLSGQSTFGELRLRVTDRVDQR
jgi:hypothetical protein